MNYPESIATQVGTPQGLDNYWLPFTPNRYFREHPKLIAGAEGRTSFCRTAVRCSTLCQVFGAARWVTETRRSSRH